MEDYNTLRTPSTEKSQDDTDEVGWVLYGVTATVFLVIYQFFLVQFLNTPSTITVKILMSLIVGVLVIIASAFFEIREYNKK